MGWGGVVKRGEALAIREQRVVTVVARNKAEWNKGWNWGSQWHSSVSELGLTYNTTKPSADRTRDEHYESRSSCLSTPPGYWRERERERVSRLLENPKRYHSFRATGDYIAVATEYPVKV